MTRVVLVHWHEAECAERAERLAAAGYEVDAHWRSDGGAAVTPAPRATPPAALGIDLGRPPATRSTRTGGPTAAPR